MKIDPDIPGGFKDVELDERVKVVGDNWVPVGLLAMSVLDLHLNVLALQVGNHLIEQYLALAESAIKLLVRAAVGDWREEIGWVVLIHSVQSQSQI